MLLPLVSPQFLKATIAFSTIIAAPTPNAVIFDAKMDRLQMTLNICCSRERLAAVEPRACSPMWNGDGVGKVERARRVSMYHILLQWRHGLQGFE